MGKCSFVHISQHIKTVKKTESYTAELNVSCFCRWSSDHLPGEAGQEGEGGRYREYCQL